MSMSKSSYTQYNRKNWEDADFPILCQTCLGSNPYLRMMKDKFGKECKICERPFTNFRWQPGKGARYKSTELCQTCAKVKNVCQTCMFDLEYGLPVQVRDAALQIADNIPRLAFKISTSQVPVQLHTTREMRLIFVRSMSKVNVKEERSARIATKSHQILMIRYLRKNIRDRYYGSNDPVAEKILNRAKAMPALEPPADTTITTLYVGNLGPAGQITQKDLNDYFYQFGDIRSLRLLEAKSCAFIQFTTRESCEMAAERSFNKLILKGRRIVIRWGQPQSQKADEQRTINPVPSLPNPCPVPEDLAPSSSKRQRLDPLNIPLPPLPPTICSSYKACCSTITASDRYVYIYKQDPVQKALAVLLVQAAYTIRVKIRNVWMVYPASVFITGANRGIGLGLVREFLKVPAVKHVIAGARNPDNAEELNAITDKRLSIVKIDIDCDQSIKDAYKQVEAVVGESGLNVLLNNAAILPPYFTNGAICRDTLMKCVNTNVLGTAIVSQTFLPLLRKASSHGEGDHWGIDRAAIVNISSFWASIKGNEDGSGELGSLRIQDQQGELFSIKGVIV
ncbi:hypothetical protein COOONC_18426 [Cooperia oncophora]